MNTLVDQNPDKIKWGLMIGAIGVVYGDIGTSPLYALKSTFIMGGLNVTNMNVLGLLSIFIWTLIMIVSVKYVSLVLKVDNHGEGGILVLSSLFERLKIKNVGHFPMILGIIGAALFFGDGSITPAISVLSALEGLHLISPTLSNNVVFLSIVILTLLFAIQKTGSGKLGNYFGPIISLWFIVIALLGVIQIYQNPHVLLALNPYYALHFLTHHGLAGFVILGGTILVVTGAEALYADMGHFGRKQIELSWTFFVLPSLILNYLGQGALLLSQPEAISNPFYNLVPPMLLYPMIILATIATIIASQAVISGVFSVTWQAIMLHYLPRMQVMMTSNDQMGQVYVPVVNYILYFMTIGAVLIFKTSDNLAVAYGLTVAGLMLITSVLIYLLAHHEWHWSKLKLCLVFIPLIAIDTIFVLSNMIKIVEGAWYSFLIALAGSYVVWVWVQGNRARNDQRLPMQRNLKAFLHQHAQLHHERIPNTAIFMSRSPKIVPDSLTVHLTHNKFLHEKMIFISILTKSVPSIPKREKFSYEHIEKNAYQIVANFGFKEVPDLHKIVFWAREKGILSADEEVSFFLSKYIPIACHHYRLSGFNEKFFMFLSKNAVPNYDFFEIPHEKALELGIRYRI